MKLKKLKLKLVNLPADIEMVLYFIKEDIKGHKFYNGLVKLGLDSSGYHPDFSKLVLAFLGFVDPTDDLFLLYFKLLESYSTEPDIDNEKLTRYALNIYVDLMVEKRKGQISNH